jgi:hypothetical protein
MGWFGGSVETNTGKSSGSTLDLSDYSGSNFEGVFFSRD